MMVVLVPILMTLHRIPGACLELIACNCTTGCRTERCGCKHTNLQCMNLWECKILNKECRNYRFKNSRENSNLGRKQVNFIN